MAESVDELGYAKLRYSISSLLKKIKKAQNSS